jgi:hypothetical protein
METAYPVTSVSIGLIHPSPFELARALDHSLLGFPLPAANHHLAQSSTPR